MLASCWRSGLMMFKALVRPELKGDAKRNLYYWLSIFYFVNNQIKKAENTLRKIEITYKSVEDRDRDGHFHIVTGMINFYYSKAECIENFKAALSLVGENLFYRGWIEVHLSLYFQCVENYEEAKNWALKAIITSELMTDKVQSFQIKGSGYLILAGVADALGNIEAGEIYFARGRKYVAKCQFRKMLIDIEIHYALHLAIRGRTDEAIAIFEKAKGMYPTVDAYQNIVQRNGIKIYLLANQPEKSKRLYESLLSNKCGMELSLDVYAKGLE